MPTDPSTDSDAAQPAAPAPVSTGVPGLDAILRGGLPRGGSYLVKGAPGSGKTTLGLHFLRDGVRRGERALMLSLGQPRHVLERTAASFGWNLDGIDVYAPPNSRITERLRSDQTVFRSEDVALPALTATIRERIEEMQPDRAVFDSLSLIQVLARRPGRYRWELTALLETFNRYHVTALFTTVNRDRLSSDAAEAFVDGVVTMSEVPRGFGTQRFEVRVDKLRGSGFLGGDHDFEIGADGITVHPRWRAGTAPLPGDGSDEMLGSGVAELDALLGGGLRVGGSCLLVGPSGTGKTTLTALAAHAAAGRGERAAIFSFDQIAERYLDQLAAIGIDLRPHIDAGRVELTHVSPRTFMAGAFAGAVRAAAERGATVVGIDSLSGYFHAQGDSALLRAQLVDLLTELQERRVTTLMTVVQRGVFGEGGVEPLAVSEIADTVLLLRYFELRGALHKAISVVKKRHGTHEKTIRELSITRRGIEVGPATENFSGVLTGQPVFQGDAEELGFESDDA